MAPNWWTIGIQSIWKICSTPSSKFSTRLEYSFTYLSSHHSSNYLTDIAHFMIGVIKRFAIKFGFWSLQEEMTRGLILWQRHNVEIVTAPSFDEEETKQLLGSIPAGMKSDALLPWLQLVLPSLVQFDPDRISLVVEWIVQKAALAIKSIIAHLSLNSILLKMAHHSVFSSKKYYFHSRIALTLMGPRIVGLLFEIIGF